MARFKQIIDENISISPSGFTGCIVENSNVVLNKTYIKKGTTLLNVFNNSNALIKDCGTSQPEINNFSTQYENLDYKLNNEIDRVELPPWIHYELCYNPTPYKDLKWEQPILSYNQLPDNAPNTIAGKYILDAYKFTIKLADVTTPRYKLNDSNEVSFDLTPNILDYSYDKYPIDNKENMKTSMNSEEYRDVLKKRSELIEKYNKSANGELELNNSITIKDLMEYKIISEGKYDTSNIKYTREGSYYLRGITSSIRGVFPLNTSMENTKKLNDEYDNRNNPLFSKNRIDPRISHLMLNLKNRQHFFLQETSNNELSSDSKCISIKGIDRVDKYNQKIETADTKNRLTDDKDLNIPNFIHKYIALSNNSTPQVALDDISNEPMPLQIKQSAYKKHYGNTSEYLPYFRVDTVTDVISTNDNDKGKLKFFFMGPYKNDTITYRRFFNGYEIFQNISEPLSFYFKYKTKVWSLWDFINNKLDYNSNGGNHYFSIKREYSDNFDIIELWKTFLCDKLNNMLFSNKLFFNIKNEINTPAYNPENKVESNVLFLGFDRNINNVNDDDPIKNKENNKKLFYVHYKENGDRDYNSTILTSHDKIFTNYLKRTTAFETYQELVSQEFKISTSSNVITELPGVFLSINESDIDFFNNLFDKKIDGSDNIDKLLNFYLNGNNSNSPFVGDVDENGESYLKIKCKYTDSYINSNSKENYIYCVRKCLHKNITAKLKYKITNKEYNANINGWNYTAKRVYENGKLDIVYEDPVIEFEYLSNVNIKLLNGGKLEKSTTFCIGNIYDSIDNLKSKINDNISNNKNKITLDELFEKKDKKFKYWDDNLSFKDEDNTIVDIKSSELNEKSELEEIKNNIEAYYSGLDEKDGYHFSSNTNYSINQETFLNPYTKKYKHVYFQDTDFKNAKTYKDIIYNKIINNSKKIFEYQLDKGEKAIDSFELRPITNEIPAINLGKFSNDNLVDVIFLKFDKNIKLLSDFESNNINDISLFKKDILKKCIENILNGVSSDGFYYKNKIVNILNKYGKNNLDPKIKFKLDSSFNGNETNDNPPIKGIIQLSDFFERIGLDVIIPGNENAYEFYRYYAIKLTGNNLNFNNSFANAEIQWKQTSNSFELDFTDMSFNQQKYDEEVSVKFLDIYFDRQCTYPINITELKNNSYYNIFSYSGGKKILKKSKDNEFELLHDFVYEKHVSYYPMYAKDWYDINTYLDVSSLSFTNQSIFNDYDATIIDFFDQNYWSPHFYIGDNCYKLLDNYYKKYNAWKAWTIIPQDLKDIYHSNLSQSEIDNMTNDVINGVTVNGGGADRIDFHNHAHTEKHRAYMLSTLFNNFGSYAKFTYKMFSFNFKIPKDSWQNLNRLMYAENPDYLVPIEQIDAASASYKKFPTSKEVTYVNSIMNTKPNYTISELYEGHSVPTYLNNDLNSIEKIRGWVTGRNKVSSGFFTMMFCLLDNRAVEYKVSDGVYQSAPYTDINGVTYEPVVKSATGEKSQIDLLSFLAYKTIIVSERFNVIINHDVFNLVCPSNPTLNFQIMLKEVKDGGTCVRDNDGSWKVIKNIKNLLFKVNVNKHCFHVLIDNFEIGLKINNSDHAKYTIQTCGTFLGKLLNKSFVERLGQQFCDDEWKVFDDNNLDYLRYVCPFTLHPYYKNGMESFKYWFGSIAKTSGVDERGYFYTMVPLATVQYVADPPLSNLFEVYRSRGWTPPKLGEKDSAAYSSWNPVRAYLYNFRDITDGIDNSKCPITLPEKIGYRLPASEGTQQNHRLRKPDWRTNPNWGTPGWIDPITPWKGGNWYPSLYPRLLTEFDVFWWIENDKRNESAIDPSIIAKNNAIGNIVFTSQPWVCPVFNDEKFLPGFDIGTNLLFWRSPGGKTNIDEDGNIIDNTPSNYIDGHYLESDGNWEKEWNTIPSEQPSSFEIRNVDETLIINAKKMHSKMDDADKKPEDCSMIPDFATLENTEITLTGEITESDLTELEFYCDEYMEYYCKERDLISNTYKHIDAELKPESNRRAMVPIRYISSEDAGTQWRIFKVDEHVKFSSPEAVELPFLPIQPNLNKQVIGDQFTAKCKFNNITFKNLLLRQKCKDPIEFDDVRDISYKNRLFSNSWFSSDENPSSRFSNKFVNEKYFNINFQGLYDEFRNDKTNHNDDTFNYFHNHNSDIELYKRFIFRPLGAKKVDQPTPTGGDKRVPFYGINDVLPYTPNNAPKDWNCNYYVIERNIGDFKDTEFNVGQEFYWNDWISMRIIKNSANKWKTYKLPSPLSKLYAYDNYNPCGDINYDDFKRTKRSDRITGFPYIIHDKNIPLTIPIEGESGTQGNSGEYTPSGLFLKFNIASVGKIATDTKYINQYFNEINDDEVWRNKPDYFEPDNIEYVIDDGEFNENNLTLTINLSGYIGGNNEELISKIGKYNIVIPQNPVNITSNTNHLCKDFNLSFYIYFEGLTSSNLSTYLLHDDNNIKTFKCNSTIYKILSISKSEVILNKDGIFKANIVFITGDYNDTKKCNQVELHTFQCPSPIVSYFGLSFDIDEYQKTDSGIILDDERWQKILQNPRPIGEYLNKKLYIDHKGIEARTSVITDDNGKIVKAILTLKIKGLKKFKSSGILCSLNEPHDEVLDTYDKVKKYHQNVEYNLGSVPSILELKTKRDAIVGKDAVLSTHESNVELHEAIAKIFPEYNINAIIGSTVKFGKLSLNTKYGNIITEQFLSNNLALSAGRLRYQYNPPDSDKFQLEIITKGRNEQFSTNIYYINYEVGKWYNLAIYRTDYQSKDDYLNNKNDFNNNDGIHKLHLLLNEVDGNEIGDIKTSGGEIFSVFVHDKSIVEGDKINVNFGDDNSSLKDWKSKLFPTDSNLVLKSMMYKWKQLYNIQFDQFSRSLWNNKYSFTPYTGDINNITEQDYDNSKKGDQNLYKISDSIDFIRIPRVWKNRYTYGTLFGNYVVERELGRGCDAGYVRNWNLQLPEEFDANLHPSSTISIDDDNKTITFNDGQFAWTSNIKRDNWKDLYQYNKSIDLIETDKRIGSQSTGTSAFNYRYKYVDLYVGNNFSNSKTKPGILPNKFLGELSTDNENESIPPIALLRSALVHCNPTKVLTYSITGEANEDNYILTTKMNTQLLPQLRSVGIEAKNVMWVSTPDFTPHLNEDNHYVIKKQIDLYKNPYYAETWLESMKMINWYEEYFANPQHRLPPVQYKNRILDSDYATFMYNESKHYNKVKTDKKVLTSEDSIVYNYDDVPELIANVWGNSQVTKIDNMSSDGNYISNLFWNKANFNEYVAEIGSIYNFTDSQNVINITNIEVGSINERQCALMPVLTSPFDYEKHENNELVIKSIDNIIATSAMGYNINGYPQNGVLTFNSNGSTIIDSSLRNYIYLEQDPSTNGCRLGSTIQKPVYVDAVEQNIQSTAEYYTFLPNVKSKISKDATTNIEKDIFDIIEEGGEGQKFNLEVQHAWELYTGDINNVLVNDTDDDSLIASVLGKTDIENDEVPFYNYETNQVQLLGDYIDKFKNDRRFPLGNVKIMGNILTFPRITYKNENMSTQIIANTNNGLLFVFNHDNSINDSIGMSKDSTSLITMDCFNYDGKLIDSENVNNFYTNNPQNNKSNSSFGSDDIDRLKLYAGYIKKFLFNNSETLDKSLTSDINWGFAPIFSIIWGNNTLAEYKNSNNAIEYKENINFIYKNTNYNNNGIIAYYDSYFGVHLSGIKFKIKHEHFGNAPIYIQILLLKFGKVKDKFNYYWESDPSLDLDIRSNYESIYDYERSGDRVITKTFVNDERNLTKNVYGIRFAILQVVPSTISPNKCIIDNIQILSTNFLNSDGLSRSVQDVFVRQIDSNYVSTYPISCNEYVWRLPNTIAEWELLNRYIEKSTDLAIQNRKDLIQDGIKNLINNRKPSKEENQLEYNIKDWGYNGNFIPKNALFLISNSENQNKKINEVLSDNYFVNSHMKIDWKYIDYVYISYSCNGNSAKELLDLYFGDKIYEKVKTILINNIDNLNSNLKFSNKYKISGGIAIQKEKEINTGYCNEAFTWKSDVRTSVKTKYKDAFKTDIYVHKKHGRAVRRDIWGHYFYHTGRTWYTESKALCDNGTRWQGTGEGAWVDNAEMHRGEGTHIGNSEVIESYFTYETSGLGAQQLSSESKREYLGTTLENVKYSSVDSWVKQFSPKQIKFKIN